MSPCACGTPGCVGTDPTIPPVTPTYVHRHGPTAAELAETLAAAAAVTAPGDPVGLDYAQVAQAADRALLGPLQRVYEQRRAEDGYTARHRRPLPSDRSAS